jgi:hypothetical protein
MTMKKMVKCQYHGDGIMASLHPSWTNFPYLCIQCHGKLEYESEVILYYYGGDFRSVDWEKINNYSDDVWVSFNCDCGDEINLHEGGDTRVCKCGKIYRLSLDILIDHSPIKNTEELIAESNKGHTL